MKKRLYLGMSGFLALAALASCTQQQAHTHEFVDHAAVAATCASTGTEEYKTCTGCDKIFDKDGNEITSPATTPADPNNHKGTKALAVSGTFKTDYIVGDAFDLTGIVFTIKCEHCSGTALTDAEKAKVKVTYPTEGATSFVADDLKADSLSVGFEYSGLKASTKITLGKKSNAITGLSALTKTCGFKPFTTLEGVSSTFGTIVYSFSETKDGEYKTAEQLGADYSFTGGAKSGDSKTYYVKATVDAGTDYLGASGETTLTITHGDFVDHAGVAADCATTGTESYKTCPGCNKNFKTSGEEITSPSSTAKDPTNHKGARQLVVSGDFKKSYVVGDTFDLTGVVFTVKCEHCTGVTLTDEQKASVTVTYPTSGATSFTVSDLSAANLSVTFSYSGLTATASGLTLGKKSNAITGLSALEKKCGFKPFSSLGGVSATHGSIVYSFSDAQDGTYQTASELGNDYFFKADASSQSKTFYVKAEVAEGADYLGVNGTTTITITHDYGTWNTSAEDKDTFGCVCSDPVIFNKKTSSTQILDLSASSVSMNLDGTSYDSSTDTIKSITYKVSDNLSYNLGTELSALTISDDLKADVEHHGEATLDVVVETPASGEVPECEHHVSAKVKLADALLYDSDASFGKIKPRNSTASDHSVDGYYVLMEDISLAVFNTESTKTNGWFSGWLADDKNGTNHNYEFRGTLDGNGHTIAGQSTYCGLFNNLQGAALKDLTIAEGQWREAGGDYSLLAGSMQNTTLDNVKIKITGGAQQTPFAPDLSKAEGFLCRQRFMSNTLRNVEIDARGWNVAIVFASKNGNDNAFENCSLKVGTYGYLWSHWKAGKVTTWDGLTIEGSVYSASASSTTGN